jgi:hypothetical protein
LSACALAASVVTVLFTRADLEKAELRNGVARLVLNALENMFVVVERREKERRELKLGVDITGATRWKNFGFGNVERELWD